MFPPRQFTQSNLVADVKAALEETQVDPSSLHLEITESMAMSDPARPHAIFSQLKDSAFASASTILVPAILH